MINTFWGYIMGDDKKDAELLLQSGIVIIEAQKCGCNYCANFLKSLDSDFLTVAVRFAKMKKTNPSLLFQILIEEWNKEKILEELPTLYG
jgi:hypothetical protein